MLVIMLNVINCRVSRVSVDMPGGAMLSVNTMPGACIIKLIMAKIYGFHSKLECLSLASVSSLVYCLGINTLAYYGNRK